MKRFLLLIFVCLLFANIKLFAVPAIPTPIEVTQPDGTTLTIRVKGDERFHYITTEDGFLISKNQQNFYVYATVSQTGELQPSARIARNANVRTADDTSFLRMLNTEGNIERLQSKTANNIQIQRAPSAPQQSFTGSLHLLVILVNFTDVTYYYPQSNFVNMTNLAGYNYGGASGSVKDYFISSSYGKFTPDFDVVGPYTLNHPEYYYGRYYGTRFPPSGYSNGPGMIVDACTAAHNAGVDFTQYDTDGDGYVDNVMVIFAGYNQAESYPSPNTDLVWPHRWMVVPGSNVPTGTNITFDGKKLYDYSCTSELKGKTGNAMCGIGTFCHEFSHVVGLMDYYNTDTEAEMLGAWSTMASGNYNNNSNTPPVFSAYDRFAVGWLTPEQYTSGYRTVYPQLSSPTPPANTDGYAYLVSATASNMNGASPSPSEFFIIEHREQTGFDAYLPSAGMLIWHIDYVASVWNNNTVNNANANQTQSNHMHVYIQPTNGLTNTAMGDPFPTATVTSFTPKLWNGTSLSTVITNITKVGTSYVTFGVPVIDCAALIAPDNAVTNIAPSGTNLTWNTVTGATGYKVYFDTNSTPTTLVSTQPGTTYSTGVLSEGTTYYWKVISYNGSGDAGGCEVRSFKTLAHPVCATLTNPANAATDIAPDAVTLAWNAVAGATGYKVYFDTNSSPTTLVSSQTTTSYSPGELLPNTTYYWKIISYNDLGDASGCEVRSFTTMAPPVCAALTNPANTATNVSITGAHLTWDAVSGVTGYKVYFDTNPSPATLVSNQTGITYTTGALLPNTTYYWTIIPFNAVGEGTSCEVRSFTTECVTYNNSEDVKVCNGGSYTCLDGTELNNMTEPTSHTNNLHSIFNCDSVVVENISVISADLSVTKDDDTHTLTANQAGAQYQWYKNCDTEATPIENATEQSYKPTESGFYSVEIDYLNCTFYSDCINAVITGNELVTAGDISLYPNPVSNELFIINNGQTSITQVQILDITGKTIVQNCKLTDDSSIDVSSLTQGVYLLKIETDKGNIIDKFIKK